MFVHCCHCRDCQRQTGSAFVLNALLETDRITLLSGVLEPVAVPTDSGSARMTSIAAEPVGPRSGATMAVARRSAPPASALSTSLRGCRPTCTSTRDRSCRGSSCRRTSPLSRPTTMPRRCGPRPVSSAAARSLGDRGPSRRGGWCSRPRAIGPSRLARQGRHAGAIGSGKARARCAGRGSPAVLSGTTRCARSWSRCPRPDLRRASG
jgi:hypothetical protein